MNRRRFVAQVSAGLGAAGAMALAGCASMQRPAPSRLADEPIASIDLRARVTAPLWLEQLELLEIRPREILLVARTRDGVEAWLPANARLADDLPLFFGRVLPHFINRDLRDIEALVESCHRLNYKIVGLSFWNAVAHLEMLALEAAGQAAGMPVHSLLGTARRDRVSVYLSSRERRTSPQQEIDEFMAPRLAASGAKACKLGIGGRMSRNLDASPGRSTALVQRARQQLGADVAICVDANGSYDVPNAIEIGRMLEAQNVWFFEEPCPFEEFDLTREVNAALAVPIAGGEQDSSLAKWRWMIENGALDIVQPDLFYAGGFLRSLRIARWAEQAGLQVVPHAPRAHAATATLLQFVALLDRPGAFHEYSAAAVGREPAYDYEPRLVVRDGALQVPVGPGFGIRYDSAAIRARAQRIEVPQISLESDD